VRNVARVVEYSSANVGDDTCIRCQFMGLLCVGARHWAGLDVIAIDRSAIAAGVAA